jgi:ECF transporter S component (folate family)
MTITRKITTAAFFTSIAIILTRFFGIVVPLGGYPSLSLDFGSVPITMAGIILGPIFGGIVGFSSDMIGFFIVNNRGGVFHYGFLLNAVLTGVIPGLIYKYLKNKNLSTLKLVLISVMYIVSAYYFLVIRSADPLAIKLLSSLLLLIITAILIYYDFKLKNKQLKLVIFTVLIIEIFVYIALTPIWLYQLYELPYIFSALSRVFRAILLVPIKTLLIYQSLKILKNYLQFLLKSVEQSA